MHMLHQAVAQCRTLVVEGPDGIGRSGLLTELARHGFLIRRASEQLHHVDPCRRTVNSSPRRACWPSTAASSTNSSTVRCAGDTSRVTWIQALDFAEAVAERDGALVHLTAPQRKTQNKTVPQQQEALEGAEEIRAYERAFRTLSQHIPVVTVDVGGLGPPIRAPNSSPFQLGQCEGKLTVG